MDFKTKKKYIKLCILLFSIILPISILSYLSIAIIRYYIDDSSPTNNESIQQKHKEPIIETEEETTSNQETLEPQILGESTQASSLELALTNDKTNIESDDPALSAQDINYSIEIQDSSDCIQETADIMLILDRSGSMTGEPLENAKLASTKFVELIPFPDNQIALVSFANKARLESKLIQSKDKVITKISSLQADGSTNTADAIIKARNELLSERHNPDSKPIMILLADGKWNTGTDPVPEAKMAKDAGIRIIVIAFGQLWEDEDIPINENDLLQIASPGEGNYYTSADASELQSIYETIFQTINIDGRDAEISVDLSAYEGKIDVSSISDGGSFIENNIIWDVTNIGCESSKTLAFVLSTTCLLSDKETISVFAKAKENETDDSVSNTVVTMIHSPILEVTETSFPATAEAGDKLEFAIRVENTGSGKVFDLKVVDDLPDEYFSVDSSTISENGYIDGDKIIWKDNLGGISEDNGEFQIYDEEAEIIENVIKTEIQASFEGYIDSDLPDDVESIENKVVISSVNGCYLEDRSYTVAIPSQEEIPPTPTEEKEEESEEENESEEESPNIVEKIRRGEVLNASTNEQLVRTGQNVAKFILSGSAFILLSIGGFLILTKKKEREYPKEEVLTQS